MVMRITGMSSGMDIDKLVSDLMKAEKIPVNKLLQKKQTLSWKTDKYREVNTKTASFRDVVNGMRLTGSWSTSIASSSDATSVTATAAGAAGTVAHTMTVNKLASGAMKSSSSGISSASLVGSAVGASVTISGGSNDTMKVTLNGVQKTLTLTPGSYNPSQLVAELQTQLNSGTVFGPNQIKASLVNGNQIELDPAGAITTNPPIIVNNGATSALASLGFTDGQQYKSLVSGPILGAALNVQAGVNDQINVNLNGVVKTLTLTAGSYANNGALVTQLQNQLNNAFGANQVKANLVGNQIELDPVGTAGNQPNLIVTPASGNNAYTNLGFTSTEQSFKTDANNTLTNIQNQFNVPLSATSGQFQMNGVSISYTGSDTINSIISQVNASAAGVYMSYDSITDKVTFTSKGTGATAQVQATDVSGNLMAALHIDTSTTTGSDADVTIDAVQSYRSSNNFTVNGVTYNLLKTTASPVTINVSRDTDAIFNKIKDFVKTYNDNLALINARVNEPVYRSFTPLTDDQKSAMKDSDIKNWEDKAQSGLLKSDDILKSASSNFRSFMSTTVQSIGTSFNALNKIGITTQAYNGSYNAVDSGTLVIDESKLKAAIAQDPDGVISLFSNQPSSGTQTGKVLSATTTITSSNNQLSVYLNGVTKIIQLNTGTNLTPAQLQSDLDAQLTAAFGAGKISASLVNGNQLQIAPANASDTMKLNSYAGQGLSTLGFTDYNSQRGVAQGMYEVANTMIDQLSSKAGKVNMADDDITTDLGSQLRKLGLQITDLNNKLSSKEDYYYRQFSAMEQAIQKNNSQLSFLSQLGK